MTTAPNGTRSRSYASEAERLAKDPVGSVSIIDVASRSVVATPTFGSAPRSGSNIRSNTGMDFEPEYITADASGTRAWVSLREANAVGLLAIGALARRRG